MLRSIKLQTAKTEKKIEQLMDHYFDENLEKDIYERRKTKLFVELKQKEAIQKKLERGENIVLRKAERILELSKSLTETLKTGNPEEKVELIKIVTSNLTAQGKNLIVSMCSPFFELANPFNVLSGAPNRDSLRKNPCVFDTLNIKTPCARKPLTREQLKRLFDIIVESISELPDNDEMYDV
jgi:hypothetical protein